MNSYTPLPWLPVPGYENLYEINALGTIRSIKRSVPHGNVGQITYPSRFIVTKVNNWGYRQVRLSKEGKTRTLLVHRLLALTCVPNPLQLPYVNHIDGNKLNNALENLEWVTHSLNVLHAYRNNLITYKSKPVVDTKTGKVYADARAAAERLSIPYNTLRNYLNGNIKSNPTTLCYQRRRRRNK